VRARQREKERAGWEGGGGGRNVIGMRNAEEEKEKEEEEEEWPGERNAHNAVISVFDLPISLWAYYVGTLSFSFDVRARALTCVGAGRLVLFHPHYYSVGRSRADSLLSPSRVGAEANLRESPLIYGWILF